MRISKILVPIDFSPPSRLALKYAIAFARRFHAKLTLLHVVEKGTALTYTVPTIEPKITREQEQQARKMLPSLVSSRDEEDLQIRMLVKTGDVVGRIVATIRQEHSHLIVIGTHGRSLLASVFMGSVTRHLLRSLNIPVMIVGHASGSPSFRRILFATDLSDAADEAWEFVRDTPELAKADLIALHAVDLGVRGGAEASEYLGRIEAARAKLDNLIRHAPRRTTKAEARLAETSVAETIVRSAEDNKADLLVLAIERTNPREASLRSTLDTIVREARIPVLSIPLRAQARIRRRHERETKAA